MKTHTKKTPTAELLIVELQTKVINSSYHIRKTPKGILIKDDTGEKFISNKYTLLGKPDEISEEDATQLIPMYFDHEKTAVEHLIQMIESEIYWDANPLGEEPQDIPDLGEFTVMMRKKHQAWREAEQKTFDKNRSIILVKN